ncbi:hypothetical protein [Bacillus cereus]|uniref:hypothetical protein n=1 Tax=Bacillus cereus TaxID=1396 RepID=UPI001F16CCC8|nr:hypothetical protein [Bacillus cereus]
MFEKIINNINNMQKDISCNRALHIIECIKKHQDNVTTSITVGPLTKSILVNTQDLNITEINKEKNLVTFNEYSFSFKTMGFSTDFSTLKWINDTKFELELISNHKIPVQICFIAELNGISKEEYFIK